MSSRPEIDMAEGLPSAREWLFMGGLALVFTVILRSCA